LAGLEVVTSLGIQIVWGDVASGLAVTSRAPLAGLRCMDCPALACGRLHSVPSAAAGAADLGGELRELLFLDDEMWAEDNVETPPPGADARRGAAVTPSGGAYAPAGVREAALAADGTEGQSAAAGADGGQAHVCSHPLWPVLVDYYFACRKARALRRDARGSSGRRAAHGERRQWSAAAPIWADARAAWRLRRRLARPTAPPFAPSTASARSWRTACRRCVLRAQTAAPVAVARRYQASCLKRRARAASPPPQLNAASGRPPYVMGTDPELDGFLVRARSLCRSSAKPSIAARPHPNRSALHCDARRCCRRSPL
jgi:hypothetical protein